MTNDEREILIRIDQKVADMHEHCDRHGKQIKDLYDKTTANATNIARIAGAGLAVGGVVGVISLIVSMVK